MSASFRRPRPGDQATVKAPKCARSTSTSRRSISPSRDYPRGTSTATRPSQASPKRAEDRPAPAQDLEAFKAEMTSILSDMLHSFLSNLASQFKPSSGGQGDSVSTQNVASDQEKILSDTQGIPSLDSLRMTEEEERDFNTFSLVPVTVPKRSWRAQEDLKSHSQAHDVSITSQTRPVISQVVVQAQSTRSVQSDQRSDQTQKSVQDQPVSQAHFPVLVPQGHGQGQGQGIPVVVRRDDLDSLYNEEESSLDLDNEAILREKQACSEAMDRVAEFL